MSDPEGHPDAVSLIGVTRTGERARLTTCRAIDPLKVLNPRAQGDYCAVILSSYGGGLVAGDRIHLRVTCGPNAALYLGTQALTKIYKSPSGLPSTQTLTGAVDAGGCAIVLPDPAVPYAQSVFHQRQHWRLVPNACLVLADGHTAGREAFGERFAYTAYASDITLTAAGRPILIERYRSKPGAQTPAAPGAFGAYSVVFNIFVAGTPSEPRYDHLRASLQQSLAPHIALAPDKRPKPPGPLMLSYAQARPEVFVVRALARNVESLRPLYRALSAAVSHPALLGADPLARKY